MRWIIVCIALVFPCAAAQGVNGLKWVRSNPMFVSGLTVEMGVPPDNAVTDYEQRFRLSDVHLWQAGLPSAARGWVSASTTGNLRYVSWLLADGTSLDNHKVIGGAAPLHGRIGYQVSDEPRNMTQLTEVAKGIAAVRQADPSALVYANFGDRTTPEMLTYYCQTVKGDLISYDHYTVSQTTYERLALYSQAGLQCGVPYWRYIYAYDQGPVKRDLTADDLRWDAFLGLAYGFTGHTWFLYQIRGDPSHLQSAFFSNTSSFDVAKTDLYSAAATINTEMRNLGRGITQLTSTGVYYAAVLPRLPPKGTTRWHAGAGLPYLKGVGKLTSGPDVLLGAFEDASKVPYVLVQNACHSAGACTSGGPLELEFDFSGAPSTVKRTGVVTLNRTTGQPGVLPLEHKQADQYKVHLALDRGDAMLLKLDDGHPFALGPAPPAPM